MIKFKNTFVKFLQNLHQPNLLLNVYF